MYKLSGELNYSSGPDECQENLSADATAIFMRAYEDYKGQVYEYALLMTQSQDRAMDVVQDVYLKLWIDRDKLYEIEQLKAYLYRITRNKIIDQIRRSQKEQMILSELAMRMPGYSEFTENILEEVHNKRVIEEAVRMLPKQRMLVYSLGKLHGWKRHEIASMMGISEATVRVHMNKALRFVKEYVMKKTDVVKRDVKKAVVL